MLSKCPVGISDWFSNLPGIASPIAGGWPKPPFGDLNVYQMLERGSLAQLSLAIDIQPSLTLSLIEHPHLFMFWIWTWCQFFWGHFATYYICHSNQCWQTQQCLLCKLLLFKRKLLQTWNMNFYLIICNLKGKYGEIMNIWYIGNPAPYPLLLLEQCWIPFSSVYPPFKVLHPH